MDETRFEGWLRAMAGISSRRGMLAALGGLGLAALPGVAGAKRRGRKNRGNRVSASAAGGAGQGRYQTLAAKWWAWALGPDDDFGPILDTTGALCTAGQHGKTWFLAGSFFDVGPITRTCSVPRGTTLFFPVLNQFCAELPATFKMQLHELRACAAKGLADSGVSADELTAQVDGRDVPMVRAQSALFPLHLDEPNFFGAPAGTYLEAADGYWVLLDPLSPGAHTIRFMAGDKIDVTYQITVA